MPLPLEGLRVISIEQYGAGPYGTQFLSDMGAEILKVEDLGQDGDVSRYIPPYMDPEHRDSLFFQSFNRGKRSIALDLRRPEGKEILRGLAAVSDAIYSNLKGDQPHKLGITYAQLKDVNPRLVCCSLSGYGMTGPRAAEPAYDYLIQAYSGLMSLTGEPGTPPAKVGISIADFTGGYASALGLMTGLWRAKATGEGGDVDVALLDAMVANLNYLAIWNLNAGYKPEKLPDSSHPTLVPSQNFRTADGYMTIMCNKDKFYHVLCELIGRPDLSRDPRFATPSARLEHREALIPILKEILAARPTAEWMELLKGQVPAAPVNDFDAAMRDDQVLAREMVIEVDHPHYGKLREVGCPIKYNDARPAYRRAPFLGEHTDEILASLLRYSTERIAALRQARVIQ
jgi:crotonobetainyl-CoA:carnitine CoA-transferase CaiB-like acyl-CoA transferase